MWFARCVVCGRRVDENEDDEDVNHGERRPSWLKGIETIKIKRSFL